MIDDPWSDPELPLSAARQLDEICCRFDVDLQAGKAPRIEAFLDGAVGVERRALLRELLAMELQYRRQRREPAARDLYQARFPHERDVVEFVFREADSAAAGSASAAFRRQATLAEIPSSLLTDSSRRIEHFPGPEAPRPAPHLAGRPLDLPAAEGRYATRELLARGGMGEVFRADDELIGRRVALKRLRPGCDELRERFLAEAQITGQLGHPGIVPLYDVGQDGEGGPFYIMKLVEGSTLRQAIKDHHQGTNPAGTTRPLRGLQLLQVFVNLCQTVAYAHSRGVIYRDLKPDNVMLGAYGETLILDWGLAKRRGPMGASLQEPRTSLGLGGSTATHDGTVVGSPSYMSPEAASGKHEEVTERSDVFLLGATLYEILTGVPPRRGSSAAQLLELARTVDPSPPRSLLPSLPRRLEAICLKAMARRPEDRYGSPLELADDVQRFLAEEPVTAFPDGRAARCWRWCKRRRRQLALAGMAVALLVCAGLAVAKVQEVRQWRQRERARRENRERVGRKRSLPPGFAVGLAAAVC